MPDISILQLPDGSVYTIKDSVARELASKGIRLKKCTEASDTPYGVTWLKNGVTITGTLVASQATTGEFCLVPCVTQSGGDAFAEYITVEDGANYSWEKVGTTDIDLSNLGALAYKDTASYSYTPQGAVSQPSFTGTEGNVSVNGTPSGTITVGNSTPNYTPSGVVSAPEVTVTHTESTGYVAASTTGGGSVVQGTPASAILPVLTTSVDDENLIFTWDGGSFTPNSPTAVTLPTFSAKTMVEEITGAVASAPSFTGESVDLEFNGNALNSTGKFTPNGVVSQPTFNGTQENIVVS